MCLVKHLLCVSGDFLCLGHFILTNNPRGKCYSQEEPGSEKLRDFLSDPQEGSGRLNLWLREYFGKVLNARFFKRPRKLPSGHLRPCPRGCLSPG